MAEISHKRGSRTFAGCAVRIGILLLLLLVGFMLLTRSVGGPDIAPGSTLLLDLAGSYEEAPEAPILDRVLGDGRKPFIGLLSLLAMAERDDRIAVVVLRVRGLSIGWGKAQELRDGIARVRAAGRRTIAVLELAQFDTNRELYVASAAEEVYVVPGATVPLVGLAAEYLFLGGLWENLDVTVEVERIGKYKSATESFAGKQMSDPARQMANSLLESIDSQFVAGLASSRGLEESAVRSAIDAGPVLPAQLEALGLIDGVRHVAEVMKEIDAPVVKGGDYASIDPSEVGFEPAARFALVYGSGGVVMGDASRSTRGSPVFAASTVSRALLSAADDPEIDAIILRIDSPGGSSLAAEVIWEAASRARAKGKPLVTSISDVAASGGYYVAVASDHIVAPAASLTGSIGVFVLRPVLGGLLHKLGVGFETLTRGKNADFLLSMQPLSPGSRERLRVMVLDTYDLFLDRVSEGRDLERAAVDAVAQGRVWTGEQALEVGLIDELGGLHAAVDYAKTRLDLDADDEVMLIPYPAPRSLTEQIAELVQGGIAERIAAQIWTRELASLPVPESLVRAGAWLLEVPFDAPLAVPPLVVDIR